MEGYGGFLRERREKSMREEVVGERVGKKSHAVDILR
jgi:hypothetical protein